MLFNLNNGKKLKVPRLVRMHSAEMQVGARNRSMCSNSLPCTGFCSSLSFFITPTRLLCNAGRRYSVGRRCGGDVWRGLLVHGHFHRREVNRISFRCTQCYTSPLSICAYLVLAFVTEIMPPVTAYASFDMV